MNFKLKIWRQADAKAKGGFETYEVNDISEDTSFLEMLDILNNNLIHEGKEPVAFDHDCREGICGMCSLHINGEAHGPDTEVTTCQLHMRKFHDGDTITIEPWRSAAFPVIKDLVVERSAFDKIMQAGGFISVNTGGVPDANTIPVPRDDAEESMDAAACIGCGACVATCKNGSAMLFVAARVSSLAKLPPGKGRTGAGARVGDDVWVSGTPGDAFAALGQIFGYWTFAEPLFGYFRSRMDLPEPRVALGPGLLNAATACCDISDGLVGDLKHILERSGVSARLFWPAFPKSDAMKLLPEAIQQRCILSGGDDYELLFTAPSHCRGEVERIAERAGTRVSRIGEIVPAGDPLKVIDANGAEVACGASFNHFREAGS